MVDFEKNMGLVESIFAKHFKQYNYIKDDLLQEGYIALLKACNSFNNNMGYRFSTYAYVCIKNGMLRFIKKEDRYQKHVLNYDEFIKNDDIGHDDFIERFEDKRLHEEYNKKFEIENIVKNNKNKDILMLYMKGYSYADIANMLGTTKGSIIWTITCEKKKNSKKC